MKYLYISSTKHNLNEILFGNKKEQNLMHATTQMNSENMLSEGSQSQKYTCVIPFIQNTQNRQIYKDRK